ncbi:unnamed protein product [Urochloa humidicola]
MAKAWNTARPLPVQGLENNRYIIEFESEDMYNFVTNGGPLRHKGGGLIVVPYDGLQRPSEVVIDAVNVWVRFYDVPVTLRTEMFSAVLAKKVSPKVLDGGGSVPNKNFLRAGVALALKEPLKLTVEAKVKGQGAMSFDVGYENVPFFCFTCGRMGHSKWECPEEDENSDVDEVVENVDGKKRRKLGEWMRKSPLKRSSRQLTIPTAPTVKWVLYFSGDQLARFQAAGSVTSSNSGRCTESGMERYSELYGTGKGEQSPLRLPWRVNQELSEGVKNLEVGVSASQKRETSERNCVSGLNSFMDSSARSNAESELLNQREAEVPRKGIQERLWEIKAAKAKEVTGRKGGALGLSPIKDMDKHQRKKALKEGDPDVERASKKLTVGVESERKGWKEAMADALGADHHMATREEVDGVGAKGVVQNSRLDGKLGDMMGT